MGGKSPLLAFLLLCFVFFATAEAISIKRVQKERHNVEDDVWVVERVPMKNSGGAVCNVSAECHHGECSDGKCVCTEGWASSDCSYALKSKTKAFTLSFLIGNWGADQFYLGFVALGIFKLFGSLFFCCLPCVPLCFVCCTIDELRMKICYFATLVSLITSITFIWVWWLVDWLAIVGNDMEDSDGFNLLDDM